MPHAKQSRRPCHCRPRVLELEARLPLGDTALGVLAAASLLGGHPGVDTPGSPAAVARTGDPGVSTPGFQRLDAGRVIRGLTPPARPADGVFTVTFGGELTTPDWSFSADAFPATPRRRIDPLFTSPQREHGPDASPLLTPRVGEERIAQAPALPPRLPAHDDAQLTILAGLRPDETLASRDVPPAQEEAVRANFARLPLSFEANAGQAGDGIDFLARGPGYTLALSPAEATMVLNPPRPAEDVGQDSDPAKLWQDRNPAPQVEGPPTVLRMQVLGGNAAAQAAGVDRLPGVVNYFLGNDPSQWHTGIATYEKVLYRDVYAGIDLVYYGSQDQLEYDFVVHPGADPDTIRLGFDGAERVELDADGALVVWAGGQALRQAPPVLYQEADGERREVAGRFVLEGRQVGFAVGAYDTGRPLVIDPVLSYSTYLGGSSQEWPYGIAVDGSGNAFVTGFTLSLDFPTANPFQPSIGGLRDTFVTKLSQSGDFLVYSSYLGGSGSDYASGIAVDPAGNAYVTGFTYSRDFPTREPFQPAHGGGQSDGFLTKVSASGSALVYSSYLGGASEDNGNDIAVDAAASPYLTGSTWSTNFPTVNAYQPVHRGGVSDAFVTRLRADGAALVFSTYFGGSGGETSHAVAVHPATGDALLTGSTSSADFPTANPLQPACVVGPPQGCSDAFVARLRADGAALVFSTYLGGNSYDYGDALDVDLATGDALVTGNTGSRNFPTANPLQETYGGSVADAFVARLRADGSALVFSTYLGGSSVDYAYGLAVDPTTGDALLTGYTNSSNFPIAEPLQPTLRGFYDAFVTRLRADGRALVYSTYLGGSGNDAGFALAVDGAGNAFVTGQTDSTNFPTANPFQPVYGGNGDAFVARIGDLPLAVNVVTHGFNPNPLTLLSPFDPASPAWASFLQPWSNLGRTLDQVPLPGSPLYGRVQSYVSTWDSSRGWMQAFASLGSAILCLPYDPVCSAWALVLAPAWMNIASRKAALAAQTIVRDLTAPGGLLLPPAAGQVIHLIGHSRGGAVNARVSSLLRTRGYTVDQYTGLDGYSTDWPGLSGILGDISIVSEATARRKVNYRVQDPLNQVVVDLYRTLTGGALTPLEIPILLAGFADWRAPPRAGAGFEDITLLGVTDGSQCMDRSPRSDHMNITRLYAESECRLRPAERYILDNYVGRNRGGGDSPGGFGDPGDGGGPGIADDNPRNFTDGSFEELGRLWRELNKTQFPSIDSNVLRLWVGMVRDPLHVISTTWTVTGNATIISQGNNTALELTQTADTSLGQPLHLAGRPLRVEFDMNVRTAGQDDRLEVVFRDQVLGSLLLRNYPGQGRYFVSLAGLGLQPGEVTFRITGPQETPAVIQLDNLAIKYTLSNPVSRPVFPG